MGDYEAVLGIVDGDNLSPFRYISTPNIPAADECKITAGKYLSMECHYTLFYMRVIIVCSASVGNRKVKIDCSNWNTYYTGNITANETKYIHGRVDSEVTNLVRDVSDDYSLTLNDLSFLMSGDDVFRVGVVNPQASDVFSAQLGFKYRNKDFGIFLPAPPAIQLTPKKWCSF